MVGREYLGVKPKKSTHKEIVPEKLTQDELRYIYRNKSGKVVFTPVYKIYSKAFFNELANNISIETDFEEFRDTSLYERFMLNAAQFSAAKSASEAKLIQGELFDEDKNFRSYPQFKEAAEQITDITQKTWLRVEYDTARRQAVQAQAFIKMREDADVAPYWVYRGMMDDREREEHVEMEGKVFRIGDPEGDACFPPVDWNCRCDGDQVDDEYLQDNNTRAQTNQEAGDLLDEHVDEQFRFNPADQGILPKVGSYFDLVGTANDFDYKDFNVTKTQYEESLIAKQVDDLTPQQKKSYDNFERDSTLSDVDKLIQEKAILKVVQDPEGMVDKYLEEEGNVVNTDSARPLFKDIGYNGTNTAAVHEPSSVVAKGALKRLVDEGENNHISFYAGGSGAGKTSSIDKIFPDLAKKSDAIIDGNLSNFEKALKQVNQYLDAGKSIDIVYVYRPPEEAWKGVIYRMLHNEKEMGRLVPLSTFLKNTEGSWKTMDIMFDAKIDELPNVHINMVDNSFGTGKAQFLSKAKFKTIRFDKDLEEKCKKITKEYFDKGEITLEQYNALLQ